MTPEGDLAHGGHVASTTHRPIRHKVRITTVRRFCQSYLGADPLASGELTPAAWLSIPEQHLRTPAVGGVFRDDLGELERARDVLRWYPRDVWLYLLAAEWRRIQQEEPFMARCGDVGDELGSRIEAVRRTIWSICPRWRRSSCGRTSADASRP